jgi:hypothetical protein
MYYNYEVSFKVICLFQSTPLFVSKILTLSYPLVWVMLNHVPSYGIVTEPGDLNSSPPRPKTNNNTICCGSYLTYHND